MKRVLTFFMILLGGLTIFMDVQAQAPSAFNYQAVARNNGAVVANTAITVYANVRRGSAIGTYVYKESHTVTTDDYGMFSIDVGNGTATVGTLGGVDWSTSSYFLQIEVNFGGNTRNFGASRIQSVPYALYAKNGSKWETSTLGITYQDNVGIGVANPQAPLHIEGHMGLQSGSDHFSTGVNSDGQMFWKANSLFGTGAPSMVLDDDNQNLGIGTASPTERLHVAGGGVKIDQTTTTPAPGTAYGNSLPIAYAYINGASVTQRYGVTGMTKPSAGEYVITLDNNFSGSPVVIATSFNSTPTNELITYDFTAPNQINIHINKDSGPADSNFSFVVFGTAQ